MKATITDMPEKVHDARAGIAAHQNSKRLELCRLPDGKTRHNGDEDGAQHPRIGRSLDEIVIVPFMIEPAG